MQSDQVSKIRVLVFLDWYLPGFRGGGPIKSLSNLVNALGHQIHFSIVTRDTDYCEPTPYPNIEPDKWVQGHNSERIYYLSKAHINRSTIEEFIKAEDYDAIYLNSMFSWYFAIIPLWYASRNNIRRLILAPRGMLSSGSVGVHPGRKNMFLRLAKLIRLFKNVTFHATSEAENADIRKMINPEANIHIAPNLSSRITKPTGIKTIKQNGSVSLVSIARIAPEKNLLLAIKILSQVKGNVNFDIYGSIYNRQYWDACLAKIEMLNPAINVVYKGVAQGEQITSILSGYHFMLMPTTGENFGHVIFESLAAATPVIISDLTPWKDLERFRAGYTLSLNEESRWIEVIDQCVTMSSEQYRYMAKSARNYAHNYVENQEDPATSLELFHLAKQQ